MGERYEQLSLDERCTIAQLREAGQSIRQIASALDRPPSTISRELERNSGSQVGYKPSYAQQQARARRWSGSRLERDDSLRAKVLDRLGAGWSPEEVAGRLKLESGRQVISYETIYRFIYAQIRRTQDFSWRLNLTRGKSRRGRRGHSGGSSVNLMKMRQSIRERPSTANDRQTVGHWEADYMLFKRYGHNILVAHERKTRLTLILRPPSRKADVTAHALARLIGSCPSQIGVQTYFCDPRSPWQKGGVENAIGRLRRYLPRKANLDDFTTADLDDIARQYNNTPRKCLDYRTPAEACLNQPLHFECESTS